MSSNISNIVEDNWDQLKKKIKKEWYKLPVKSLSALDDGRYEEFVGKLKKTYGYTQLEVEDKLREFLEKEGFDDLSDSSLEFWQRVQAIPQKVANSVHDITQTIRDNTSENAETVKNYVKENPLLTVGIAAGIGFVLAKLLHLKIKN